MSDSFTAAEKESQEAYVSPLQTIQPLRFGETGGKSWHEGKSDTMGWADIEKVAQETCLKNLSDAVEEEITAMDVATQKYERLCGKFNYEHDAGYEAAKKDLRDAKITNFECDIVQAMLDHKEKQPRAECMKGIFKKMAEAGFEESELWKPLVARGKLAIRGR